METTKEACQVPPAGWHCTRAAGHEGPCAAHPETPAPDAAGNAVERIKAAADILAKAQRIADEDSADGYEALYNAADKVQACLKQALAALSD